MATWSLAARAVAGSSYGMLRKSFFGTASVYGKKKGTSGDTGLGDIVREDEVKVAEIADVADNFRAAEIKETVDNEADLGDIVRDDVAKATQIDEHSGVSDVSKENGPSPFSIDDMLLESATDGSQDGDDFDDEEFYYYDSEDEVKRQILTSALEYVPEHGWTEEAIQKAAEAEGLSSAVDGLFPRGAGDLVLHFIEECNGKLAEQMLEESRLNTDEKVTQKGTAEFIQDALMMRLQMIRPYIHTWPQAVRLLMHPDNAPTAMESLAHMVDEVWYHAGDTSTDFNWYTKRGSLAAIYGASELFMTQDRSADFENTRIFVQNRLANVNQLKSTLSTVEQAANGACDGLSMLISTAQNMLGYNCRKR